MNSTTKRKHGVYDTPEWLARQVLDGALSRLGRSPLRVLDPSVGKGVFLRVASSLPAELVGWELDPDRASCVPHGNIHVGDFLAAPTDDAYDMVIGNPPWVSYSGRHAQEGRLEEYAGGWKSLHSAFIEKAARHLAPGGVLGFVVPWTVAHQRGYARLRGALASMGELEFVTPTQDGFADVTMPYCILYLRRCESITAPCSRGSACWPRPDCQSLEPAESPIPSQSYPEGIVEAPAGLTVRQAEGGRHADPRLQGGGFPAGQQIFGDPGVHTGNARELILSATPRDGWVAVREGKDLTAYHLRPPALFVDPDPSLPSSRYARVGQAERYLSTPILIRQTATRPIAAVHDEPAFFRNSILACYGLPGHSPYYLVALLNSRAMAFFHRVINPDSRQSVFPQVKVSALARLPIPVLAPAIELRGLFALAKNWLSGEAVEIDA